MAREQLSGSPIPVRIQVRTDVDWRAMTEEGFRAQDDETRPLRFILNDAARRAVELWNETFAVDFFTYRAALQDIAYGTYRAAGADELRFGFADFDEWWDADDEQVVVAMDDDDLLAGPLAEVAAAFADGVDVVLWPRVALALAKDGTMEWRRLGAPCIFATNCAFRRSFLQRHFSAEVARKMLADHRFANDAVADLLGVAEDDVTVSGFRRLLDPRVVRIPETWSLKNAHVGSIQLLNQTMGGPDPVGRLRGLSLEVVRPIPEHAEVFAPQVDALEQVWRSLRVGAPG